MTDLTTDVVLVGRPRTHSGHGPGSLEAHQDPTSSLVIVETDDLVIDLRIPAALDRLRAVLR